MGPSLLVLNQVKLLTGGLALLEQVRFTQLPADTKPDGLMDTEVFLEASEENVRWTLFIRISWHHMNHHVLTGSHNKQWLSYMKHWECLLCCLIVSSIHRICGRTGDGDSIMFVWQSDGLLHFSCEGLICVLLYCVVGVLLEIPGEFRRGVWTGSGSWAGYSDRLLLLQITWDLNSGARRRICGLKLNTDFI